MVFYPSRGVAGYAAGLQFKNAIAQLITQEIGKMKATGIKAEFTGDIEAIIQEQDSLKSDLVFSSTVVLIFEMILIVSFYSWWPCVIALGVPLALGVLTTFAISWFLIGGLNASTAFLGSIIVGNGINSGIILLARFVEECRSGGKMPMTTAVKETIRPTLAASCAAALAYGSLTLTSFRGYSQFGLIGGIGMILCWVATYIFVPPLSMTLERYFPIVEKTITHSFWDNFFEKVATFSLKYWRFILGVSVLISVLCLFITVKFARDPFEYNTNKLKSSQATRPGGYLDVDKRAEEIMKRNILPIVVLAPNAREAELIKGNYRKFVDEGGTQTILENVFTLNTFVPPAQSEKMAIMKKIRDDFPEKKKKHLKGALKKYFDQMNELLRLSPFGMNDLPTRSSLS